MTLVLRLIMNEVSVSTPQSLVPNCSGFMGNLGYIVCDRRQNLNPKFAQVAEQSEFTYSAYLVAAGTFKLEMLISET